MATNQNQKEEEVDLGSLFVIIGKGFSKLFGFIGSIFKGIYFFIIQILLFVKLHFLKIIIAFFIGAITGLVIEMKKEKVYGADLILQPNFKSSRQLYNNVNFYNELVKQKDTLKLASTFNISKKEAGQLRKFEIESIVSENDIVEKYDELILSIDTTTIKSYSFDKFKKSFTNFDYKVHKVHVESLQNDVFSKLDSEIISSIIDNPYFSRLKIITRENLYRTDSLLRKNLTHIDTLRQVYMKVMLEEAKKNNQGTSIDLGGDKKTTKEIELFQTNRIINKDLKEISEDISEKSEVINVISNFQSVGYEIKSLDRNYIVLLSLISVFIVVLLILIQNLNRYLDTFKK